jgi:hypothetical protein
LCSQYSAETRAVKSQSDQIILIVSQLPSPLCKKNTRRCGIATFATDLWEAIADKYKGITCIALPVNDTEAGYARRGDVDNVIFLCGYTLHLSYGATDTGIALATASVKSLLEWLKVNGREKRL